MNFFSEYSQFLETSDVASEQIRLNFRYNHIIEKNRQLISGKRVLDIASHDGRFSFAALKGGAKYVLGIEARDHLVKRAHATFDQYNVPSDTYDFMVGDVFEKLTAIEKGSIDTVMILGFLYHTVRQYELFHMISEIGASAIIIDSNVLLNPNPIVRLKWEGTSNDSQIWDSSRNKVLSSQPSASALAMFAEEFGYSVTKQVPEGVQIPNDYRSGRRVTMCGIR